MAAKGAQFAIGDIVKLKSHGPNMTVRSAPDLAKGNYICQWFAGKKLEQGVFPEQSLESAPLAPAIP